MGHGYIKHVVTHYGHESENILLQLLAMVGRHLGICRYHHLNEVGFTGGATTPTGAVILGCRQVRSEVNNPGYRSRH